MRHLFESVSGHLVDHLHVHLDPCALSLRYAQCYPFNFFTTCLHVFIFTNCPPHPSEAICSLPRFRLHDVFNKIKMAAKLTVRKSSTEQKNWMTQFFRSTFADSAHCLLDWVSLRLNVCKFSQNSLNRVYAYVYPACTCTKEMFGKYEGSCKQLCVQS